MPGLVTKENTVDEERLTTAATDFEDGGNEDSTSTGTPANDDRNAEETQEQELARLREERKLVGALQEKALRVNEAERRATEAEARLREREESPTATAQGADPRMAELEADLAAVEANYRAGVPGALTTMRLLQDQLAMRREMADDAYLARLREPAEEKELATFYKQNRAHFNSMPAAHDALRGRRAVQEIDKLAREKAALKVREADAAEIIQRKESGVVATHQRGVTTGEVRQRKMSETVFQEKIAQLEADGREGDAYQLRKDRLRGKIIV